MSTDRRWTRAEHSRLVKLAAEPLPAKTIAQRMDRSAQSVQSYAERNGISIGGYWTRRKS